MMNRGLGSIMGYRGGGMPVARFQEGGVTDALVRQYLDSRRSCEYLNGSNCAGYA
jgi:hypothetical protein